MDTSSQRLGRQRLVARVEQAFELGMALGVGLASPAAGLVALLALGSATLDVAEVGERLVRWSGSGLGGQRGHAVWYVAGSGSPTPSPAASVAEAPAMVEAEEPPEPGADARGGEGEQAAAGASEGPVEQGGSPSSLLGSVAEGLAEMPPSSDEPGFGMPWGTVRHGTGRLDGGGSLPAVPAEASAQVAMEPTPPLAPLGPPRSHSVDAAGGMRFVAITGGGFWMGSPEHEPGRFDNEGPRHRVELSPYWLAATEVTRAQWVAVMGGADPGAAGELPVVEVSWCDAVRYANALSEREGLSPAYRLKGPCGHGGTIAWDRGAEGYRLPTEAEWELAARGGREQLYAGSASLDEVGWFLDNAGGAARPVARLAANPHGLHDMSGNVWEWVWDRLGAYSADPQRDPAGPERGETRILRGGSWRYEARYARVADRNWSRPGYRSPAVGFRLARSSSAGDLDALVSEE
jgi:sulfatase modifying factor 1